MMKSGLAKIISDFNIESRLTATQDLILVNIDESDIEKINKMFNEFKIDVHESFSLVRKSSMACPALPTCSLAMAESERFLPSLIDDLEEKLLSQDLPVEVF